MIQIPVTINGNSQFDISIDGEVYTFHFKYNTRNERLYLTILKDEVPVIEGLRLIEFGLPILNYTLPNFASGQLFIAQFERGSRFATLGNTGIDEEFSLVYFSEEEFNELIGG
jgi:hypothetical protein